MSLLLQQAPSEAPARRTHAPTRTQDNTPDEITIARFLLDGEAPDAECVYQLPLVIRRYLSEMNQGDTTWIRFPLFSGLAQDDVELAPYQFTPRDRLLWREKYPDPDDRADSRLGIALEFIGEALAELQDFLTQNDLQNNRLISAVAGAIRGEIKRLVDYVDQGCPAELEDAVCAARAARVG